MFCPESYIFCLGQLCQLPFSKPIADRLLFCCIAFARRLDVPGLSIELFEYHVALIPGVELLHLRMLVHRLPSCWFGKGFAPFVAASQDNAVGIRICLLAMVGSLYPPPHPGEPAVIGFTSLRTSWDECRRFVHPNWCLHLVHPHFLI